MRKLRFTVKFVYYRGGLFALVLALGFWAILVLASVSSSQRAGRAGVLGSRLQADRSNQTAIEASSSVNQDLISSSPSRNKKPPASSTSPTPTPTVPPASPNTASEVADPLPEFVRRTRYVGKPLPGAASKKELLVGSFNSPFSGGWMEQERVGTAEVDSPAGKGLAFHSGKVRLHGGETFANSGTVSFWLKFDGTDAGYGEVPILQWNFDGNGYNVSLFEVSATPEQLIFSVYGEGGDQYDLPYVFPDGSWISKWHFIKITWDLTLEPFNRAIYIDNKKVAEDIMPFAPTLFPSSAFIIGGDIGNRKGGIFSIAEIVMTNWVE